MLLNGIKSTGEALEMGIALKRCKVSASVTAVSVDKICWWYRQCDNCEILSGGVKL